MIDEVGDAAGGVYNIIYKELKMDIQGSLGMPNCS